MSTFFSACAQALISSPKTTSPGPLMTNRPFVWKFRPNCTRSPNRHLNHATQKVLIRRTAYGLMACFQPRAPEYIGVAPLELSARGGVVCAGPLIGNIPRVGFLACIRGDFGDRINRQRLQGW